MAWEYVVIALSILATMTVKGDFSMEDDVQNFVNSINNKQSSWAAVKRDVTSLKNQLLQNQVDTSIHASALADPTVNAYKVTSVSTRSMPRNYDTSAVYPECDIRRVKHQNQCGCCWAVSSAGVMQDRLCMHSDGKIKVDISAAHLVGCCKECSIGCGAGSPIYGFAFMMKHGIVTGGEYNSGIGCYPFPLCTYCEAPEDGFKCPTRTCPNKRYSGTMETEKYYVKQIRLVERGGEPAIREELFNNGPVVVPMEVHEDFMYYTSGIYQYTRGNLVAGHFVRLIGYGTENGVDYWIGVNSWSDWGENGKGSFRILRGVNESGIEQEGIAAIPYIPGDVY